MLLCPACLEPLALASSRQCHAPHTAAPLLSLRPTARPGGGKSDVVSYSLPAPSEAGEEGGPTEEGHWPFALAELRAAGTYSAVAEYSERRAELAAALSKKEATLRSATVRFAVQPGQPVMLR